MWHLDPSRRLATINMGRKVGAVPPFRGSCVLTKWHLDPFSHNRHQPKIGGSALLTFPSKKSARVAAVQADLLSVERSLHMTASMARHSSFGPLARSIVCLQYVVRFSLTRLW